MKAFCLVFALSLWTGHGTAWAQQTSLPDSPGADWGRVETLPPGVNLHLAGSFGKRECKISSATTDALICESSSRLILRKSEIGSIKEEHRGRSAAVMGALGAGIGVLVVAATGSALGFTGVKGTVAAGGAAIGAVIFAPIGYFADPTASTVYRKR